MSLLQTYNFLIRERGIVEITARQQCGLYTNYTFTAFFSIFEADYICYHLNSRGLNNN